MVFFFSDYHKERIRIAFPSDQAENTRALLQIELAREVASFFEAPVESKGSVERKRANIEFSGQLQHAVLTHAAFIGIGKITASV